MDRLAISNLIDATKEIVGILDRNTGDKFTSDIYCVIRRLVEILASRSNVEMRVEQTSIVVEINEMLGSIDDLKDYLINAAVTDFVAALQRLVMSLNVFCLISDVSSQLDAATDVNRQIIEEIISNIKSKPTGIPTRSEH